MVRTWAEKEMRNLTRMYNENIPCPKPVLLRSHVLLMEFIGQEVILSAICLQNSITEAVCLHFSIFFSRVGQLQDYKM